MKTKFLLIFFLLGFGFLGYWAGQSNENKAPVSKTHLEKKFPLAEKKAFALIVYGCNQASWCERALRSIFEQDYDYYRVIFIDDGSTDKTFDRSKAFILDNNQDQRVLMLRNETKLGLVACLYRAIDNLLDREIAVFLNAKDWLSHNGVLNRLNLAYQNPEVWMIQASSIAYPFYEIQPQRFISFYSAIFKQLRLDDLFQKGRFAETCNSYLKPMSDLCKGRIRTFQDPFLFVNETQPKKTARDFFSPSTYSPLTEFPKPRIRKEKTDIVLFSFDRPMQLYACLESIYKNMSGFEALSIIYRVSNEQFAEGYEKVKAAFPLANFIRQSSDPKHDFKPLVLQIVFGSACKYVLFGVDDIVVKDNVDLNTCMEMMEKTAAYGFYLRFGHHIRFCYQNNQPQTVPQNVPLTQNIYAWDLKTGEGDWGFPNNVDMTLFRKSDLKEAFVKMKYKTPNSLEFIWASEYAPQKALGLFFEHSKIVNIPLNIVGKTGNPHMDFASTEDLLTTFNEGMKIDIEPLYRIENSSPHFEFAPEFIPRL